MEDILHLIQDLHWYNTWIEGFSKEVKSDDYSFVLEYKHRKLYSILLKKTKITFLKLFGFQIWNFVFRCLHYLLLRPLISVGDRNTLNWVDVDYDDIAGTMLNLIKHALGWFELWK